ncbi:MAG: carboxylesterase [Desulfobacterales bacterium]|nr:carboxylesterase [Desulfobacterales bacterium]
MTSKLLECVEINPAADPEYVVIWLHSLWADGHDLATIVPALQLPDSLLIRYLFPHAPQQPDTVHMRMATRTWYDLPETDADGKVDLDGILTASQLLRNLIQRELDSGVPSEKILLAGFSQGGSIALHTALRYEKPLAGIMALSTCLPIMASLEAERHPANRKIPIMMAHGEGDSVNPIADAENTREELARLSYAIQWYTYPMAHHLCIEEIADIRSWMLALLQPGS